MHEQCALSSKCSSIDFRLLASFQVQEAAFCCILFLNNAHGFGGTFWARFREQWIFALSKWNKTNAPRILYHLSTIIPPYAALMRSLIVLCVERYGTYHALLFSAHRSSCIFVVVLLLLPRFVIYLVLTGLKQCRYELLKLYIENDWKNQREERETTRMKKIYI